MWEKNGILPKSPLVVSGKFYYTESMIKAIVLSYLETGQGKRMTSTELFKNTLWERFNDAVKKLDQAAAKNICHDNAASRKKSQMAIKLNSMK